MIHKVLAIFPCILLVIVIGVSNPVRGQDTPDIEVLLPVHGYLAIVQTDEYHTPKRLIVVDTFTGENRVIAENEHGIFDPVWDHQGQRIAYYSGAQAIAIWDNSTGTTSVIEPFVEADSLFLPLGWSSDGNRILYEHFERPEVSPGVFRSQYRLGIVDLTTQDFAYFLSFEEGERLNEKVILPTLPSPGNEVSFWNFRQAAWNPVYDEWIALQVDGSTPDTLGYSDYDTLGFYISLLYNLETGDMISLNRLFPAEYPDGIFIGPIVWNETGDKLLLETSAGFTTSTVILDFHQSNGEWTLTPMAETQNDQVVMDWFGVGDILLTLSHPDDYVLSLAHIEDNQLEYVEFVRIPPSIASSGIDLSWRITATSEEEQQILCLFDTSLAGCS